MLENFRATLRLFAAVALMASTGCATTSDRGPTPAVEAVPGQATVLIANYDMATLGYRTDEFFLSGTAASYQLSADGDAEANGAAPYVTRIVVTRPIDAARFNGTVLVEWMNVTAGMDVPTEWLSVHRELARSGYVHVGVSAQRVGIEGGQSMLGAGMALKRVNPERYGRLAHPGDAYSFDIFSQAGRVLRGADASLVLGGLRPQRLIAAGELQSATFLSTYVNAVDPVARVYDGFLVHSRFGFAAVLEGLNVRQGQAAPPAPYRSDLRVPVLTVVTETDVADSSLVGYYRARAPDSTHLRVWEIAGSSHSDNYMSRLALRDNGTLSIAEIVQGYTATRDSMAGQLALPANTGHAHHYVMQAALAQIDNWVRTNRAPPQAPPLLMVGEPPSFALDANGLAQGGVRTPWADVPTERISGVGNSGGPLGFLAGVAEPFDAATLARLYPGGRAEYLRRFELALDRTIANGFILAADRQEILEIAAASYAGAP